MRAMILAAGYGTRLWPLTIDRAKPALPFMGRPLVGYVAEYLARFDCREIVVNLHHRSDSVRAALGDGSRFGVRLRYIEEPEILGTSGALDNARRWLEDDTFIVINGKIATDIDLSQALETHRRTDALATLVLQRNPARARYSTVEVCEGLIHSFGGYPASDNAEGAGRAALTLKERGEAVVEREAEIVVGEDVASVTLDRAALASDKSAASNEPTDIADADAPLMFTGIQILEPRIFSYIPRGVFSHTTTDVYPQAIARGERVAAHIAEGKWYELSTIRRYLDTSLALMRQEGRDVEIGRGSIIEAGADVDQSVLWENVYVEAGARVRRAVLGAGVRVRRDERFENAVIVRTELVAGAERPAKALAGEARGDNFVVPLPQ